MSRILLAGLISPALVLTFLLASLFITEAIGLNLVMRFIVVLIAAMVGFIIGVILLIRLSARFLKFAKVKEKC